MKYVIIIGFIITFICISSIGQEIVILRSRVEKLETPCLNGLVISGDLKAEVKQLENCADKCVI
jgi:hypothetical protein